MPPSLRYAGSTKSGSAGSLAKETTWVLPEPFQKLGFHEAVKQQVRLLQEKYESKTIHPLEEKELLDLVELGNPYYLNLAYLDRQGKLDIQQKKELLAYRVANTCPDKPKRLSLEPDGTYTGCPDLFAPQMIRPWLGKAKNNPAIQEVSMNDSKVAQVLPEQTTTSMLLTHGLVGCNVTLLMAQHPNGQRTVALTHYPAYRISAHLEALRGIVAKSPLFRYAQSRKKAILFSWDHQSNHYPKQSLFPAPATSGHVTPEQQHMRATAVHLLKIGLADMMGKNLAIEENRYPLDRFEDSQALYVKIPPHSQGPVMLMTSWEKKPHQLC